MLDKLDFLVRFWELNARHSSRGEPLASREQRELLSLMQLVTDDLEIPEVGPCERPKNALPAQMSGDGAMFPVEIRSIGAGAVIVGCASPVPAGARVVLRSSDAITGVEYALPCNVLWIHRGAPTIIALGVEGIPTRRVFVGALESRASTPPVPASRVRLAG